jgi:hypothetical protein
MFGVSFVRQCGFRGRTVQNDSHLKPVVGPHTGFCILVEDQCRPVEAEDHAAFHLVRCDVENHFRVLLRLLGRIRQYNDPSMILNHRVFVLWFSRGVGEGGGCQERGESESDDCLHGLYPCFQLLV